MQIGEDTFANPSEVKRSWFLVRFNMFNTLPFGSLSLAVVRRERETFVTLLGGKSKLSQVVLNNQLQCMIIDSYSPSFVIRV